MKSFQIPFPAVTIITEFELEPEFRDLEYTVFYLDSDAKNELDIEMAEDGSLIRYTDILSKQLY